MRGRGLSGALIWTLVIAGGLGCVSRRAVAEQIDADPSTYLAAVARLVPGDVLRLAAGEYLGCLHLDGVHGQAGAPITITGPESGAPAVFRGSACEDSDLRYSVIVFIEDSSHVVIKNLELDGERRAVSGVRAGFGTTPVHHLTLENLYIHDNDVTNQPSGISAFCTTWDWVIRNNRIERVGLGMYLGDSDGTDPFIRGLIEHNLIISPRGYGAQLKHQNPRQAVAGMPGDGSVTIVRHNVIIKADNAALADDARPNLLLGAFPTAGPGQNDRYEVYGNFFFQNQTDLEPLLQAEGNVAIHDNLFVNDYSGTGIWIRPHNGVPRDVSIYRNTIVTRGIGLTVMGGDPMFAQRVVGNAVFANGMPAIIAPDITDNITGTLVDAASALLSSAPVLGQLDLHPRMDQLLGSPLALEAFASHVDFALDFDGEAHDGARRGAYAGEGGELAWRLAAEIKPPRTAPGGPDAGLSPDGGEGDAGTGDAGEGVPDAGQVASDGGTPMNDAGEVAAAEEGCACSAPARSFGASSSPLLLLMVFVAFGARGRCR